MLTLTPILLRKTSTVSRSSIDTILSSLTVSSNLKQETRSSVVTLEFDGTYMQFVESKSLNYLTINISDRF